MSGKLIWTGLFFIVAFSPAWTAFGGTASPVIAVVGAILMLIGIILMWLDK